MTERVAASSPTSAEQWRFRFWRFAFFAGIVAVCAFSLLPPRHLPDTGGFLSWNHALAYFALMAVSYPAYRAPRPQWRIAGALVALGIGLEGVQSLLPERVPSVEDIVANTVGVLAAIAAARLVFRLVLRGRSGVAVAPGAVSPDNT